MGGGGHRLPCVSCGIPVGTRGSESTGVTRERGKSTVAHGKNIAFGDEASDASMASTAGLARQGQRSDPKSDTRSRKTEIH